MLRPGMLARATFTKSIDDEQIVIPRHTILEKERGRVVYVFDKGKVFQRDIQVGLSQKDQVQVIKGHHFSYMLLNSVCFFMVVL